MGILLMGGTGGGGARKSPPPSLPSFPLPPPFFPVPPPSCSLFTPSSPISFPFCHPSFTLISLAFPSVIPPFPPISPPTSLRPFPARCPFAQDRQTKEMRHSSLAQERSNALQHLHDTTVSLCRWQMTWLSCKKCSKTVPPKQRSPQNQALLRGSSSQDRSRNWVMWGCGGRSLLFSPTVWAGPEGEQRDTHTHTHRNTHRNVHANVAPTL